MKEANECYSNCLERLEKKYPDMQLSFQVWNIHFEMNDVIQSIETCFQNNEFETNCMETYFSIINDMIFDAIEQLRELKEQLRKEVDRLNIELGWTYRM